MSQNIPTLHVFPTDDGFFNLSPFCCKAEILLQMVGLPYTLAFPEDYKVFPKGKLPVLSDGKTMVEDSEAIRQYLENTKGACFTSTLDAGQRATGHALCRMLEERTYFALVYSRWVEEDGWGRTRPIFFEGVPDEAAEGIRGQMSTGFRHSGLANCTADEIKACLEADLNALAVLLGDAPYFFGTEPSFIDPTVFGFIANFYAAPEQTWARELVVVHPNLVAYFNRTLARWYPAAVEMSEAE
ncbi:glutathione S-transferase family protein [Kordiimonas sp.]|uniref:glutathione S-transferase family protein n=1 Tax=Kordiimonas sp. TaxID=1970157 RepID=UPI003A8EDE08